MLGTSRSATKRATACCNAVKHTRRDQPHAFSTRATTSHIDTLVVTPYSYNSCDTSSARSCLLAPPRDASAATPSAQSTCPSSGSGRAILMCTCLQISNALSHFRHYELSQHICDTQRVPTPSSSSRCWCSCSHRYPQ